MKKFKLLGSCALIFILSVVLSFYFEERYRRVIRFLFESLTDHKILFRHPAKDVHFASDLFVLSFGLFMVMLYYFLLRQQNIRKRLMSVLLALTFLITFTVVYCYFDGTRKLVECTACNGGTRVLMYWDIRYDAIFVAGLVVSILPVVVITLKDLKLNRSRTK